MITTNPFEELASLIREVQQKQDRLESKLDKFQSPLDAEELITRFEKARQLKVSLPTLRNWEIQGLITPVRIGRKVFFRKGTNHPKSPTIHTH